MVSFIFISGWFFSSCQSGIGVLLAFFFFIHFIFFIACKMNFFIFSLNVSHRHQNQLDIGKSVQFPLMLPSSIISSMHQCIIHGVGEQITFPFYLI